MEEHRRQLRKRLYSQRYETAKKSCSRQDFQLKVRVLEDWFTAHKNFPYPSYEEKLWLASQGCISVEQVSNWFANARRRIKMAGSKASDAETQILNFSCRVVNSEDEISVGETIENFTSSLSPHSSSSSQIHNINHLNNNGSSSPRKYKSDILMRYLTENTDNK